MAALVKSSRAQLRINTSTISTRMRLDDLHTSHPGCRQVVTFCQSASLTAIQYRPICGTLAYIPSACACAAGKLDEMCRSPESVTYCSVRVHAPFRRIHARTTYCKMRFGLSRISIDLIPVESNRTSVSIYPKAIKHVNSNDNEIRIKTH